MKPVCFHPEATDELETSVEFYEARREGLGDSLLQEVQVTVARISEHPRIGALYKETGFRHLGVRRFPFVVFYLDQPDALWIVAVAHASRKPNYWSGRTTEGIDPTLP